MATEITGQTRLGVDEKKTSEDQKTKIFYFLTSTWIEIVESLYGRARAQHTHTQSQQEKKMHSLLNGFLCIVYCCSNSRGVGLFTVAVKSEQCKALLARPFQYDIMAFGCRHTCVFNVVSLKQPQTNPNRLFWFCFRLHSNWSNICVRSAFVCVSCVFLCKFLLREYASMHTYTLIHVVVDRCE